MNQNLQKRLNLYAAAAGAVAATGALNSQIIYTDINPDTIVHDTITYDLDMDNNGQPELRFETVSYQASSGTVSLSTVTVLGDTSNAIIGSLYSNQYPLPSALNAGDSIAASNPDWNQKTMNNGLQYLGIVYGSYTFGNFLGANDKYLGVRFKIGTETHYGWVRLSVNNAADTIFVKDYAYEVMPDVGLTASQMVGIQEHSTDAVAVYTYNNMLHVNRAIGTEATVTVYNMMGEVVLSEQTSDANYSTSLQNLTTGIYMVSVKNGELETVTKIYVR
jgi:hypothetical protein